MTNRALLVALVLASPAAVAQAGLDQFEDEASFLAAVLNPLHEDFDGFGSNELILSLPTVNVSAVSGVNFGGVPVSQFVTAQDDLPFPMLGGLDTSSPPNLFSNDLSAAGLFASGTITFEFESTMTAIGFFVADGSRVDTFRIELFADNVLVGIVHSAAPKMLPDSFFGVLSNVPFDKATFGSDNTGDSWGIDDLYTQVGAADCSGFPCGNNDNKVLLCHVPPGNTGNEQTLCISPNAVDAHLENHPGDHCGPCGDGSPSFQAIGGDYEPQPCPNDVNGDGTVSVLDLIDLLLCLGQPGIPGCEAKDVNGDGTVNVLDLIEVLLAFGTACP